MKKFLTKVLFFLIVVYILYTFISQQKMINSYAAEKSEYQNEIKDAKEEQNSLTNELQSLNSTDYIEDVARNKLDMYLPNEKVFVDMDK